MIWYYYLTCHVDTMHEIINAAQRQGCRASSRLIGDNQSETDEASPFIEIFNLFKAASYRVKYVLTYVDARSTLHTLVICMETTLFTCTEYRNIVFQIQVERWVQSETRRLLF